MARTSTKPIVEVENTETEEKSIEQKPNAKVFTDDQQVVIVCKDRAGKKVYGTSKEPIVFNEKGEAECLYKDAKYFLNFKNVKIK